MVYTSSGDGGGIGISMILLFLVIGAILVYVFRCKLLGMNCPSPSPITGASTVTSPRPSPSPSPSSKYCSGPGQNGISTIYIKPLCPYSDALIREMKPSPDIVVNCSLSQNASSCLNVGDLEGPLPGFPAEECNDGETVYIGY